MPQTGQARKREGAIAALLTAPTLPKAAEAAGISLSTLRRWLADPTFLAEYRKAKGELVGFATGRLKSAMSKAVEVLEEVAGAKDCPAPARVAAARAILETAIRSHELDNVAGGIDTLRELLDESRKQWERENAAQA